MKICVILTGGTIGSKVSENVININRKSGYALIEKYKEYFGGEGIAFDVKIPFQSLSENFTPKQWEQLCETLYNIEWKEYQGIVIAHGTDTLSYTCSLIGMLFAHAPIPIIFVASNYPLEEPKSNGLNNFKCAVEFIKKRMVKGVFTIFQNDRGENIVYLSTRLVESDTYTDQFTSYGMRPLAMVKEEEVEFYEEEPNPSIKQLNQRRQPLINNKIAFQNEVLLLRSYPGLDYTYINLDKKPKAILHYLYHSATGCTQEGRYGLVDFIKKCKIEDIPVYVASFKDKNNKNYVTANEIIKAGAVPMYNISLEAAYTKIWIAYNQKEKEPEQIIANNIFYEQLPKRY